MPEQTSSAEEIEAARHCFACGVDNPIGLHIPFALDADDRCSGIFTPNANHVGYQNTVHGGIIYTALDDVMANVMYLQNRKAHTARCEVRYRHPLKVGETIELLGWIEHERRRRVRVKGEARRKRDNTLIAECDASFMLV